MTIVLLTQQVFPQDACPQYRYVNNINKHLNGVLELIPLRDDIGIQVYLTYEMKGSTLVILPNLSQTTFGQLESIITGYYTFSITNVYLYRGQKITFPVAFNVSSMDLSAFSRPPIVTRITLNNYLVCPNSDIQTALMVTTETPLFESPGLKKATCFKYQTRSGSNRNEWMGSLTIEFHFAMNDIKVDFEFDLPIEEFLVIWINFR